MPDQKTNQGLPGKESERLEEAEKVRAGIPPMMRAAETGSSEGSAEPKNSTELKTQENLRDGTLRTEKE